jgi:hypothetical protein
MLHSNIKYFFSTISSFLLIATIFSSVNFAQQSATATIEGNVTDANGAVIAGANVKAINKATSAERTTVSDSNGNYSFRLLPIGIYSVKVEKQGFSTKQINEVALNIEKTVRVDVQLDVGQVQTVVEVTSEAPITETSNTVVGDVIENRRIVDLPLNGRNFVQLTLLAPNTAPQQEGGNGGFDTASSGNLGFVVNGGRNDQNNYLIDGIGVVDHYFNTITVTPSIEAIQEFRVLQNSYSSESGMFGSGQVNIATKSGTNQVNGSVFYFLRRDALDARNFFDLPSRQKPKFTQDNFGGSIGFPIKKDRTFMFFTYEGLRIDKEETVLSALPTQFQRQGLFTNPIRDPNTGSNFPTVVISGQTFYQIPNNRIGPVARDIINKFFPVPNFRPTVAGLNHVSVDNRTEDRDQFVVRFDHQINLNNNLFARYIWSRSDQSLPFGDNILTFDPPPPPGFPTPITDDAQNLAVGLTTSLTSSLINELRVGWNYYDGKRVASNSDVNFAQLNGINVTINDPNKGYPAFTIPGLSQFGDSDVFNPLFRKNNTLQFSDNVSWTRGKHAIRFGGDFRNVRFDTLSNFFTRGFIQYGSGFLSVTGDPIADFLLDRPFAVIKLQGDTAGKFSTNLWGVFINDEFRITPKLMLTFGLRYEVFPPIREKNNRLAVYDQASKKIIVAGDSLPPEVTGTLVTQYNQLLTGLGLPPAQFVTSKSLGLNEAITKTDWTNFAPRLGFAYDLRGNGKSVVRGAYGIFNALRDWSASSDSRNLLPFTAQAVLLDLVRFGVPIPPLSYADAYRPLTDVHNTPVGGISPQVDMPIGYIQQFTLNFQQQLNKDTVIETAYVGSIGINLNRLTTGNQENILTGVRPAPNFSFYIQEASGATSNYHSGYIRLEKRFSDGFSFSGSYTLSKSIDTVSSARENGGAPTREQDAYCLRCERALSNFDTRHRFVGSFIYDLPFGKGRKYLKDASGATEFLLGGWQIGGIITANTGQPLTPQHPLGATAGFRFPRPNVTGNPNLSSGRDPARWFNTSVFIAPPTAPSGESVAGSAGRNSITGPGFQQVDFTLQKIFQFTEKIGLQFRTEVFNLFNRPNFNLPDRVFIPGANGRNVNPNFGVITTAKNSRQIQFGFKFIF